MTGIHTEQAMTEIANTVVSNIKNQLAEVDSSQKLETKALKITLNMAENAMKFVSMPFSGTPHDQTYYQVRENKVFKFPGDNARFAGLKGWYDQNTNIDDKQSFLVYAHAVQFVYTAFIEPKQADLRIARQKKEVERIFELNLILDTLNEILNQWNVWWENNGCVRLENPKK